MIKWNNLTKDISKNAGLRERNVCKYGEELKNPIECQYTYH
jgi:hypothetical protein